MRSVSKCVICGTQELQGETALVAPFIARRVWDRAPFGVELLTCRKCGFRFFNPRMDSDEEKRLYADYRKVKYQHMREACEPWYTEKFNYSLSSPESWSRRKRCLAKVFGEQIHLEAHDIRCVLDFGGDRGDLIQDLVPNADRFVFDISGVEPVSGVQPLKSLEECGKHKFDLIVSSNVLEHVASPHEFLNQIGRIAVPGTLVFNEVPYESPSGLQTVAKRIAQEFILLLTRPRIGVSLLQRGVLRLMHEHVNYFCPAALDHLVRSMGWKTLASGVYSLEDSLSGAKMAWNFAQITESATSEHD